MKSDLLRSLALRAKNRMIHSTTAAGSIGYKDCYGGCQIKIIDDGDEEFFIKVKKLLDYDLNCENPIKRLMNEEKLLSLDTRGKEKYLLETIEKYLKFRKIIEEENHSKLVY